MSKKNGSVPDGLKELSQLAVARQLVVNEEIEKLHLFNSHFLRVFNGATMNVDMIHERAVVVINQSNEVVRLLRGIVESKMPE